MHKTSLNARHHALGAKMVDFAGFEMPVIYTSIIEEHMAVRNRVGLFDVSHMGEFILRGKDAESLIQKISSNDVSNIEIGQAQYCCMPNHDGGIVDDMIVYRLAEDNCAEDEKAFMLVVNASNITKDWNWIAQHNAGDCKMINISNRTSLLALQGPKASSLLASLTDEKVEDIKFYHFIKGNVAGIDNVLISATGYTGSGGYELYVENGHVEELWEAIMAAGEIYGLQPCGLGARDTLRLEMGYCLYGNDIDDSTSPLEAGLGWVTKLKKEEEFNSKAIFQAQKEAGLARKLVGFNVKDRRVPRKGYEIMDSNDNVIGEVTSGTQSPMLDAPIGMGYVSLEHSKTGAEIFIAVRKKRLPAIVTRPPFVDVSPK